MRTLLSAALLACAIPVQAAPSSQPPQAVPDLRDLVGNYQLSDGRTLQVSKAGMRVYATLDDVPRVELVSAGGNAFIARNGALRLDFVQHANGYVSGLTLRSGERPALAQSNK